MNALLSRFAMPNRVAFERLTLASIVLGAVACGVGGPYATALHALALLFASVLALEQPRGAALLWRGAVLGAALVAVYLGATVSVVTAVLLAGTGALLMPSGASAVRRAVGLACGVFAAWWGARFALPLVLPFGVPQEFTTLASGACVGLFAGVAFLPLAVELPRAHFEAALEKLLPVECARALGAMEQSRAALRRFAQADRPPMEKLLQQLDAQLATAALDLAALDGRLAEAGQQSTLERQTQLRAQAQDTQDAELRAELERAALVLGDALEAGAGLERDRERQHAQVQLQVAKLERLAMMLKMGPSTRETLLSAAARLA